MKPRNIKLLRKLPFATRMYALVNEVRYKYDTNRFKKARDAYVDSPTKILSFESKFRIKVDIRERHDWSLYKKMLKGKTLEPNVLNFIKNVLKEGDIFIDIGANIGYYSLLAASIVGKSGKIYSFEPTPQTYLKFRENLVLNSFNNIIPYRLAISDKPSAVKLYIDQNSQDLNSTYRETDQFIIVQSFPINKIVKEKANLIKIDCEGCEFNALSSLRDILLINEPIDQRTKIIIEFNPSFASVKFFDYLLKYFYIYSLKINSRKKMEQIKTIDEINDGNILLIPKS